MKGDGDHIKDWLETNYPDLTRESTGRVECSKRQDWSFECAAKVFPLIGALKEYLIETLVLEKNTLRDSVLQRLRTRQFQAYLHAGAIMWEVAFAELRAITNGNDFDLNPMEMHDCYDDLWRMGALMMGDDALDVLEEGYRPWDRVHPEDAKCQNWYVKNEARKPATLATLRMFLEQPDADEYAAVLRQVLALVGEGIHESLARTMGDYLEATNGKYRNSNLSEVTKSRQSVLKTTNNDAERYSPLLFCLPGSV